MENLKEKLQELKAVLLASPKEKFVGIATTADINNPPIIFGSVRETNTTIAVTIILRDTSFVEEITNTFDGIVDYFFVDSEVKNEVANLESIIAPKIKKSKYLIYKPNDFTVESLDMLVAILFSTLLGKKVFIIGAGNIGSKVSLKLCERGADVFLFDKDLEKTKKIVEGLNLVKRSLSQITAIESLGDGAKNADFIIGCTPGIPIIDTGLVEVMEVGGKIIDAGNRTVVPESLAVARRRDIEVLSLSSLGGYVGMIENFLFQRNILEKTRVKNFDGFSLITPGTLGIKGDILVDDVEQPHRVFGVCDGLGGLLPKEEGVATLKDLVANNREISIISTIEKLYK